MSANTKIEWADHTFNPWIGCTKVSPACDHCYAEADFAHRRKVVQWGAGQPRKRTKPSTWAQPVKWNKDAERLGVRYRVFCASLADVFDNEVPVQWRRELFDLISTTPNLDWLLLTKRIGNARAMYGEAYLDSARPWPANVWVGATICDQKEANRDIPKLLAVPAAKRFLSMEPLLGPVDLTRIPAGIFAATANALTGIWKWEGGPKKKEAPPLDWVIVGGESGHGARPMHPDWVRSLRDQCQAGGVSFLFKQWGEWICAGELRRLPGGGMPGFGIYDACRHDMATDTVRIGKKSAGRLLDGREWNEVPA